jgi:hypothetical protein
LADGAQPREHPIDGLAREQEPFAAQEDPQLFPSPARLLLPELTEPHHDRRGRLRLSHLTRPSRARFKRRQIRRPIAPAPAIHGCPREAKDLGGQSPVPGFLPDRQGLQAGPRYRGQLRDLKHTGETKCARKITQLHTDLLDEARCSKLRLRWI